MGRPLVSVCIPVYNGGKYIEEAIRSVLDQTFQDFEIVILDNRSTDNTLDVVNSISDKRIRLAQNETNIGMLGNWNKILTMAEGKYIKILPADDIIHPSCLKKQVDILESDTAETISLVAGRKNIVNSSGKVLFTRGFTRTSRRYTGIEAINKNVRSGGNIIGEVGAILFRRSILKKAGEFDASIYYAIDIYLWYRMLLHGDLYALSDVVYDFRISAVSESVNIINQQQSDLLTFAKKIYAEKQYGLTWYSYQVGKLAVVGLTFAKRITYRLLIR